MEAKAEFIGKHAEMWRTSGAFRDRGVDLKRQFPNFTRWNPYVKAGNWPDGDMLPFGHIGIPTRTYRSIGPTWASPRIARSAISGRRRTWAPYATAFYKLTPDK